MKLFKLLFLYFLSFTGFLCYGDSFSNGVVAQWRAISPNDYFNGRAMYYVVSGQQWNELPDEIKADVFQIDPERIGAFFNSHRLNERDMVGHYIGSMGHVEADVISEKVEMLDEIYTSMGMENHGFYKEAYSGGVVKAVIAGSNVGNWAQTKWEEQQNWGMNIKAMGRRESKKIRMIGALPFERGVVDSVSTGGILAKAIGFENIGVDVSYVANAAVEAMQEMAGKMIFMKNNTDYVKATMRDKGLGIDMTAPYQNLQFYLAEPIGGGGGAAILASMGTDAKDYHGFSETIRATDISHWEQLLKWQKILDNSPVGNNSIVWMVVPSRQVLDNPAFYKEFK